MNEPTKDVLARDLADAEYVRGYVNCAEGGLRMHACDATYRLQRVSRIAEAAIRRARAAEAIINAPVIALFADGREPTTNERHLLSLLSWREKEAAEAKAETKRLQGIIEGLADRVAAQSALLSRKAEEAP